MRICSHCSQPNRPASRVCMRCGHLLPGAILQNRYEIVRSVTSGGMSTIYLASARHFGSDVCIVKEMLEHFADPRDRQVAIRMFASEALILRRLNHPYIPRVMDYFEECRRHYVVMDYVEGENLQDVLTREGIQGLPEDQVLVWAEQICEVLEYLHQEQPPVIFRDLKPSNIIVEPRGRIKLIDFGISRFFKPGQTQDTWNMGTAGYAPPEQYGQGQTDARSDIYALGATLHQFLTGRDPSISPFRFPPLRSLNATISAGMETLVTKALSLDPEGRFQSAREMREALQNLRGIFNLTADFVHPYQYMHEAPLCQFMLNLSSKSPVDPNQNQVLAHICLVLDISGSMKQDEKYEPLLRAVHHLVEALPEHHLLTIGLFSKQADLVCSLKPVAECENNIPDLIHAIDDSPAKFFGDKTCLAPALYLVLDRIRLLQRPGLVHRICILTDGQIHDAGQCKPLFDQIRASGIEVFAYGFGADWEIEPLWSMLKDCRGGSFKPVAAASHVTTYDIVNTFKRFAQAGRNIIATNAVLRVAFGRDVIPGDAFRYQPLARYLGSNVYDTNKVFQASIGSLEQGITYSYCFEVRLQPTQEATHEIGTATLEYTYQGKRVVQCQSIMVHRTSDKRYAEQIFVQDTREAFLILEGLRTRDPQKLLQAFRARLDLLLAMGGDARQIEALQSAIQELQSHGNLDGLSQEDQTWIETDSRGATLAMIR
jgi:serine/threonine protein kinase